MSRTRPAALLLAATLALTAGCGGDGGGTGGLDAATSPPASAGSPSPGSPSPGSASPGSAAPDGTAAPSTPATGPGSSGGPAPGAPAPAPAPKAARPTTAPSKVVTAFAACMRRHGVDVPDNVRTWSPPPGSDAETRVALLTCIQSLTPPPR